MGIIGVILLDTHIWVWWVHGDERLNSERSGLLQVYEAKGLGVSIISCWEVAKLVEYQRLSLPCSVNEWLNQALSYPGIRLLNLTQQIVVESTQLPQPFHRDPADQLIVATARIHGCPIVTADNKIIDYPHVKVLTQAGQSGAMHL